MKRFPSIRRSPRTRLVASALAAALSAGLVAGCQKPVSQDTPVKVGYSAWPGWFPWKVTEDKKLFEAEGVPVALQWFDGYLDSINALNAGQLDCNSQTLNDTISSVAGGADLQVVLQNDFSTGNDQIIAAKEITSVAGLKGKSVAAEEGTVDHFLLLKVLKDAGLSAKDITFVPLETGAAAAAFAAGKVDAAGVYAPFTTQALKRPGSKALTTSADHPGAISDLLVCRTDFIAKNPEKIQKIVDAWFATLQTIKDDPAGTLPILVERSGVSEAEFMAYNAGTTIQTLEENRTNFKPGTTMLSLPYAAEQISAFLVETGLAKTTPELGTLFNSSFVDAAK
ncbi:ABC transporter substrate-binding protein [Synechococcus sp. CS-1324]|uniref:ABC transporter substrate-binding protein n=1 Tax=unclassified Synechococcus TaxID=2626047 RepID=UPI000DB7D46B|nr:MULTISPECIES: ABC transporter substrate-binding protein [unclassified Synechococcus]MCT0213534.1 ABC transporter substrate-binding protein [Synechococcus sp. CS-1326]MCT0229633.1 ABC transporter substrate-binding protein [Synechococcus sp. CS-1324]MCT0234690.1 ABC transporter substrate-binding protein [Synechococcus sp. CS-1327]PZV01495.1 MAG: aliphatic sulfonates ABC transporter substrate-binding protein [Cyanobium sp.]